MYIHVYPKLWKLIPMFVPFCWLVKSPLSSPQNHLGSPRFFCSAWPGPPTPLQLTIRGAGMGAMW